MGDDNKIRDVIDAVTGVAKAVPVYQDVVQPAAQEIGTALQTVAKTVHVALAPVSALVWGYDQIKDFVSTKVADRLKNVPPENIVTPKPNVAGPALESLRIYPARWTDAASARPSTDQAGLHQKVFAPGGRRMTMYALEDYTCAE